MIPAHSVATRLRQIPLPVLAWSAVGLLGTALTLVFFYAPVDADQGLVQKIFYIHVPIALTAYACFGWGAAKAFLHLWKRSPGADLESYAAIHQGVIFGALTLVTGSIWARVSWAGLLLLAATMYRVELAGKRLDARLRELRELLA